MQNGRKYHPVGRRTRQLKNLLEFLQCLKEQFGGTKYASGISSLAQMYGQDRRRILVVLEAAGVITPLGMIKNIQDPYIRTLCMQGRSLSRNSLSGIQAKGWKIDIKNLNAFYKEKEQELRSLKKITKGAP